MLLDAGNVVSLPLKSRIVLGSLVLRYKTPHLTGWTGVSYAAV